LIWKVLMIAESTFRRLHHPQLLPEVSEGVGYVNGVRVMKSKKEAAA